MYTGRQFHNEPCIQESQRLPSLRVCFHDTESKKKFQFSCFFFIMGIPLIKIPFSLAKVRSLIGQK